MSSIGANLFGSQRSFIQPPSQSLYPIAEGTAQLTTPFGLTQAIVRGNGTVQAGAYGIGGSLDWAPGMSATPGNTHNNLGLASPFATSKIYTQNLGGNSFGQINPYNPYIGSPNTMPDGIANALGSFGGFGNSLSPYTGAFPSNIFPDLASMGSGGGGGQAGLGSASGIPLSAFGGAGGLSQQGLDAASLAALQGGGGSFPFGGGSVPGLGQSGLGLGSSALGMGGGGSQFLNPATGQIQPGGGFMVNPQTGQLMSTAGQGQSQGQGLGVFSGIPGLQGTQQQPQFQDIFTDPSLFGTVPQNVIPGIGQVFNHVGGGMANQYSLFSDGIANLFLQGQGDVNTPRALWGSGGSVASPLGTFEFGIGPGGGNANAGVLGAQASGNSWAMVRSAINGAMVINYANPAYDATNWAQQGFFNA